MRAGSSVGKAKQKRCKPTGGTPPTIPPYASTRSDSIGIGSLPLFTAREALANGDIVQVLPEWEFISSYSGDLWLLWAGDKHMPARMRAMIDYLSETVPALSAGSTEPAK